MLHDFPDKPQKKWKTIRVFISSTFRDMHAERDYLVRFVFPRLREDLALRRMNLVDVDLRWGVTDDQDALQLCLNEIDRCRPRFLCILGGRYGWIPPPPEVSTGAIASVLTSNERQLLDRMYEMDETAGVYRLREKPQTKAQLESWHANAETLVEIFQGIRLPEARLSITASEIEYGAMRASRPTFRFFYFRKQAVTDSIPGEHSADYRERRGSEKEKALQDLKERIKSATGIVQSRWRGTDGQDPLEERPLPVVEYTCRWDPSTCRIVDLEEFGERVYRDLLESIDAEFGPIISEELEEYEEENIAMEQYIESRLTGYLELRQSVLKRLCSHAQGIGGPAYLVLVGEPGSGKSSILAQFYRGFEELCPKEPGAESPLLFGHFVGAGPNSTNVRSLLRRFCYQLSKSAGIELEIPEDYSKIKDLFRQILQRVAEKRPVVILIDGLNQLDLVHHAAAMRWLPQGLPANVRVIVSVAGDSPAFQALSSLEPPPVYLELHAFSQTDSQLIIANYLSIFRKELDQQQYEALLRKEDACNPLYLRVALEELRTLGSYEEITERIRQLPDKIQQLFIWILDRLESDTIFADDAGNLVGPQLVRQFCRFLATGRSGMAWEDLVQLVVPGDAAGNAAALFRLLRPYLLQRGSKIDVSHGQFREAIRVKYLDQDVQRADAHEAIGKLFRGILQECTKAEIRDLKNQTASPAKERVFRALDDVLYHLLKSQNPDLLFSVIQAGIPQLKSEVIGAEEILAELKEATGMAARMRARGWSYLLDSAKAYCSIAQGLSTTTSSYEELILNAKVEEALSRVESEPDKERRGVIATAVAELLKLEEYHPEAQKLSSSARADLREQRFLFDEQHAKDQPDSSLPWVVQAVYGSFQAKASAEPQNLREQLASFRAPAPKRRSFYKWFALAYLLSFRGLTAFVYLSLALSLWIAGFLVAFNFRSHMSYARNVALLFFAFSLVLGLIGLADVLEAGPFERCFVRFRKKILADYAAFLSWIDQAQYRRGSQGIRYAWWFYYRTTHHRRLDPEAEKDLCFPPEILAHLETLLIKHAISTPNIHAACRHMLRIAGLGLSSTRRLLAEFTTSRKQDAEACLYLLQQLHTPPHVVESESLSVLVVGLSSICAQSPDLVSIVSNFKRKNFITEEHLTRTARLILTAAPVRDRCRALFRIISTEPPRQTRNWVYRQWDKTLNFYRARFADFVQFALSPVDVGLFWLLALLPAWGLGLLAYSLVLSPFAGFFAGFVLFFPAGFLMQSFLPRKTDAASAFDHALSGLPVRKESLGNLREGRAGFLHASLYGRIRRFLVALALKRNSVFSEFISFCSAGGGALKEARLLGAFDTLTSLDWMARKETADSGILVDVLKRIPDWQWHQGAAELLIEIMSRSRADLFDELKLVAPPQEKALVGWQDEDSKQWRRMLPLKSWRVHGVALFLLTTLIIGSALGIATSVWTEIPVSWLLLAGVSITIHGSLALAGRYFRLGVHYKDANITYLFVAMLIWVAPFFDVVRKGLDVASLKLLVGPLGALAGIIIIFGLFQPIGDFWDALRASASHRGEGDSDSAGRLWASFMTWMGSWLVMGLTYYFLFWRENIHLLWRPLFLTFSSSILFLVLFNYLAPYCMDLWRGSSLLYPPISQLLYFKAKSVLVAAALVFCLSVLFAAICAA